MKIEQSKNNIKLYYENKLVVKKNFETIDITGGIDWHYEHNHNANTYQTYLHCLNIVEDFINVAISNKNSTLFKECRKIILSWFNSKGEDNYKWNEHAVSTRIQNIIRFQESEHNYKIRNNIYTKIIKQHCEFLNDESNYKNNNHGLMMDAALIFASSTLNDEKLKKSYLEKAQYRIRYAFYRDFSRKGVYLENSPEYQQVALALYRRIRNSLKRHSLKPDRGIQNLIKNAIEFNKYILKPDFTYPMLGDTGKISVDNATKNYGNFVDYEAGIAVLQIKNTSNLKNSTYLTFKSGYQSKTHKHLDDLSITYFNFGQDILIDSGKYTYDKSNPLRDYFVSPAAHNTLVIKNKLYSLKNPLLEQEKLKISKVINTKAYKLVSGINSLYPGVTLLRYTIITNDNILFVIDKISSTNEETVVQNFVLNPNAKVIRENSLRYLINLNGNNFLLETYKIRKNKINSRIEKSLISEKFSKYIETRKINFETFTKQTTLVSAIYNKNTTTIDNVSFVNNKLVYVSNNQKYTISV